MSRITHNRLGRSESSAILCRPMAWPAIVWFLGIALELFCGGLGAVAQSPAPSENQVKAAFLLQFPKYVEWPSDSLWQTDGPLVIAILGKSKLCEDLEQMVTGKAVGGRPLTLKTLGEHDDPRQCQVLFIPGDARHRIPALLEDLKGSSVLTVSDSAEFLDQGGMIMLVRQERKIRFRVNLVAAQVARLKISSKLLALADHVRAK